MRYILSSVLQSGACVSEQDTAGMIIGLFFLPLVEAVAHAGLGCLAVAGREASWGQEFCSGAPPGAHPHLRTTSFLFGPDLSFLSQFNPVGISASLRVRAQGAEGVGLFLQLSKGEKQTVGSWEGTAP